MFFDRPIRGASRVISTMIVLCLTYDTPMLAHRAAELDPISGSRQSIWTSLYPPKDATPFSVDIALRRA